VSKRIKREKAIICHKQKLSTDRFLLVQNADTQKILLSATPNLSSFWHVMLNISKCATKEQSGCILVFKLKFIFLYFKVYFHLNSSNSSKYLSDYLLSVLTLSLLDAIVKLATKQAFKNY